MDNIGVLPSIVCTAAVLALFAAAIWQYAMLRGGEAVQTVAFLEDGIIEIAANNGMWRGVLAAVTVSPFLSVFVVRAPKKKIVVLLFFDTLDTDDNRRARAILHLRRRQMIAKQHAPKDSVPKDLV